MNSEIAQVTFFVTHSGGGINGGLQCFLISGPARLQRGHLLLQLRQPMPAAAAATPIRDVPIAKVLTTSCFGSDIKRMLRFVWRPNACAKSMEVPVSGFDQND